MKKSHIESRISTCTTRSPAETLRLGRWLARHLHGGDIVLLSGPLGAGKSVLARGIAEGLGAPRWLGSPTFTLVHEYDTFPLLFHADLYRLGETEVEQLGLEDYLSSESLLVVEWADRAPQYLAELAGKHAIQIDLSLRGLEEREVTIQGLSGAELGAEEVDES